MNSNSLNATQQAKLIIPKRTHLTAPGMTWLMRHISNSPREYSLLPSGGIYLVAYDLGGTGTIEMLTKFKKCYQVHHWKTKERLEIHLKLNQRSVITCLAMENKNLFGRLERLALSSDYNPVLEDKDLEFFSKSLFTQLKSLKVLDLSLAGCENITEEGIKALGYGISHHLTKLEILNITIYNSLTTDEGPKSFVSQICRHLPKLKGLALTFARCPNISDKGITAMSSLICHTLTDLQHLELYLTASPNVTDHGLQTLIANISNSLVNLESLVLKFWEFPSISDQGLEGLENLLKSHSSKLNQLVLEFPVCPNVTDKTLETVIFNIMTYQSNIQFLGLYFAGSPSITDKSLALLDLTRLPNLTKLWLTFPDCDNVTDESFKAIALKTSNTPLKLKQLDFNFSRCQFTDKGMEALASLCNHSLQNLNHINLCFSMCKNITNQGFEALTSIISSDLKSLKYVYLQFNNCGITNDRKAMTDKLLLLASVSKFWVCVE